MYDSSTFGEDEIKKNVGYRFYSGGDLFVYQKRIKTAYFQKSGRRGKITKFSAGSGMRMRRYLRACEAEYRVMVTLTYPDYYPSNGKTVKEHLRRFIQELRRNDARKNPHDADKFSCFWFLEFQERGAPHFHLFISCFVPHKWVASTWYRIVGSENEYHLHAGTRTEGLKRGRAGTISYATKYAAKNEQKSVPEEFENVGRFWGVTGLRTVVVADTVVSLRDLQDSMVVAAVNRVKRLVRRIKREGFLVELASGPENYVARVTSDDYKKALRAEISRLEAASMVFSNMFFDAEVEP